MNTLKNLLGIMLFSFAARLMAFSMELITDKKVQQKIIQSIRNGLKV